LTEQGRLSVLDGWRAGKKPSDVAARAEVEAHDPRWLHKPKEYKTPFSAEKVVASLKRQYGDVAEVTGPHTFRTDISESGVAEALHPHYARNVERTNPKKAYELTQHTGHYIPSFEEMGVSVLPSLPPGTTRG
jgi:hypothetical protein